ncbi:MAG: xanthine dehydrogenase family protein subunit M, partial [Azospirillaceae bacterium]
MKYLEPGTLDEALRLLAEEEDVACLAGGQTLVGVLNLGVAEIAALMSLRRIPDLNQIQVSSDGITVGAMATHAAVARDARLTGRFALLREAAGRIAHPAIRSQGTMGGSICHADPAADYPGVLVALDAEVQIASAAGRRSLPAGAFFVDFLATALEPGEMVTAIRFPGSAAAAGEQGVYEKFTRVDGDYATVSVACVLGMAEGRCRSAAIALGSCDVRPVRSAEAEACLAGSCLEDAALAEAGRLRAGAADPQTDTRGSADYRRRLIPGLVARAVSRARAALHLSAGDSGDLPAG